MPNPPPMQNQLPKEFCLRMQKQLGTEWEAFLRAHQQKPPVSIRLNPLKWKSAFFNELPDATPIPWYKNGLYLQQRPHFSQEPLWHAGAYYVQEASSMLIAHIIQQLNITKSITALDLGSSPGGKSTLLLDHLPKGSLILANEPISKRLPALKENLYRWGHSQLLISQHHANEISQAQLQFDLILVDAPCSGEGLFRKKPEATQQWNRQQASFCAIRQTNILQHITPALKNGGYLIYSTCTYNPHENEAQIQKLLHSGFQEIKFELPKMWNVKQAKHGYQCYPHLLQGEGFFFAALQKTASENKNKSRKTKTQTWKKAGTSWLQKIEKTLPSLAETSILIHPKHGLYALPKQLTDKALPLLNKLPRCRPLAEIGLLKNQLLKPNSKLALLIGLKINLPQHELDKTAALQYLHGQPPANPQQKRGLQILTYRNLPLGLAKGVKGRFNLIK